MPLDPNIILSCKHLELAATADPLVFEKQVIYTGSFKKWKGNKLEYEFSVDEPQIDEWVKSFKEMVDAGVKVPVPKIHSFDPTDRVGTVIDLSKKLDGKKRVSLYMKVKFNDAEAAKNYKSSDVSLFSPPVIRHQDKVWVRPIQHVGVTDYPVVGDLEGFTIAASIVEMSQTPMLKTLAETLGLTVADGATDEEIAKMIEEAFTQMQADLEAAQSGASAEGGTKTGDGDNQGGTVAASNDPVVQQLIRDNRTMKVDSLLAARKITPAQAKTLKSQFVDVLGEGFDAAYAVALSNEPIASITGTERSSSQKRSGGKETGLVADAKRRAGKS